MLGDAGKGRSGVLNCLHYHWTSGARGNKRGAEILVRANYSALRAKVGGDGRNSIRATGRHYLRPDLTGSGASELHDGL
eukprot:1747986-Alexandrium_andersonii.AAC.1